AFSQLSREERLILSMNPFAGYSSQEIGDVLGMNPNTVRSRQSRALKKMQEKLS
ncbi:MAG: sigma-70 family RNA polymerase sigma factor, partial [Lachnospiraceae bacterium]|nr:sigma-70 family RNA polymerase sigma factor [Lachnospiraceae bacterium]